MGPAAVQCRHVGKFGLLSIGGGTRLSRPCSHLVVEGQRPGERFGVDRCSSWLEDGAWLFSWPGRGAPWTSFLCERGRIQAFWLTVCGWSLEGKCLCPLAPLVTPLPHAAHRSDLASVDWAPGSRWVSVDGTFAPFRLQLQVWDAGTAQQQSFPRSEASCVPSRRSKNFAFVLSMGARGGRAKV